MRADLTKRRAAGYSLGAVLLFFPMCSLPVLAQDGPAAGSDRPTSVPFAPTPPGPDRPGGPHGGPLSSLARAEADQAASQAIAMVAKVPISEVKRVIRTWGVPAALRYFDVEPKAFHDAVVPRLSAVVQAAIQAQYVSKAEGERALSDLTHEPPPLPRPGE